MGQYHVPELPFGGHIKTVVKTGFHVHLLDQVDP